MGVRLDAAPRFQAMCFGKLPAFGDFVRHNAGGRDAIAFDQWLQQGLYHARQQLGRSWEESFRRAPSYHFLYSPENSEGFLLGVLTPSHDRGERCFPFTVALRLDRRYPADLLPLAPVAFEAFLAAASRFSRDASGMTLQEIASATERLEVAVDREYRELIAAYTAHLRTASIASVRERLWKGEDERVFLVFRNLLEVLRPLRGRNASRLALGLRFPIDGEHTPRDVSLWTETALRIMSAAGARPFLFWTAPPVPGAALAPASAATLFLFLRQPTARSIMHFLRPDLASDFICALDTDGLQQMSRARAALPTAFANSLAGAETSLAQLLEMLERGLPEVAVSRVLC